MTNTIINKKPEPCTGNHDVVQILEYKGTCLEQSFTMYETWKIDPDRKEHGKAYFIKINRDEFPIVITREAAMDILKNPKLGERLAYNRWFDRYR